MVAQPCVAQGGGMRLRAVGVCPRRPHHVGPKPHWRKELMRIYNVYTGCLLVQEAGLAARPLDHAEVTVPGARKADSGGKPNDTQVG